MNTNLKVRISRGVGSSPKLWAVGRSQVGELDLSDRPGVIVPGEYADGMTGIVWRRDATEYVTWPRKAYGSVDEWIADVAAEYPDAEIVDERDLPQNWL